MDCLSINQKVWVVKRNYMENSFGMNMIETEPFKVAELRVISIQARTNPDRTYITYKLAEEIGYKPEINDMRPFEGLTDEFREDEVFTSFESAILSILEMIDERSGELQEIRQHYLNMLQEHNFKDYGNSNWIDEDLFKMQG